MTGDPIPNAGHFVRYKPTYARLLDAEGDAIGVTAALLLSQAIYWMEESEGEPVIKTQEDITKDTGLTRREADTARAVLRECSFLIETGEGRATKTFQIDIEAVREAVEHLQSLHKNANRHAQKRQPEPISCTKTPTAMHKNANDPAQKRQPNADSLPTEEIKNKRKLGEEESALNSAAPTPPKLKRSAFCPPGLDEVTPYMLSRKGSLADAEKFVDFYAAQGWRRSSGVKLTDWQAAARNWLRREEQYEQDRRNRGSPRVNGSSAFASERAQRRSMGLKEVGNEIASWFEEET